MSDALQLPVVDLSSPDRFSAADTLRQACTDHGFFYLVNHGVDEELIHKVLELSSNFFSLPTEEKMKLAKKNHRGYTALYAEKLDTTLSTKGDSKESFYVGSPADGLNQWRCKPGDYKESFYVGSPADGLNQWPSEGLEISEDLPSWRSTMETYYQAVLSAGTKLLSLIALSLKLDEDFFRKVIALNEPFASLRLLHYPGDLDSSSEDIYGASAHSDYGMITLLVTDGIPGLQICRDKSKQPQVWEDVPSMKGAIIVNIGDTMERWTNCLFRSTLHRVLPPSQERYSVAFFMNPGKDCIVECLESCSSDACPPRFPPIKFMDYLEERLRVTYGG